jgi:putative hydrolase of the HAD superfamily
LYSDNPTQPDEDNDEYTAKVYKDSLKANPSAVELLPPAKGALAFNLSLHMTMTSRYRHVFFDLDETLWDFKRNSMETLHDLLSEHQFEKRGIVHDEFIRRYHHHNDHYWGLYRSGGISRQELRTRRWTTTLREFDIQDEALAMQLSEKYLELLPGKRNLFGDALQVLDYLRPRYSLHIITNGFEEVQYRKIETSGIAWYFTHIITSERAGSQKPQPEIFHFALDLAGASIRNSIFIGDSIEADILGAKAVGMDHVLFNPERRPHTEKVEHEIFSLSELLHLL